jgi:DNA polymerase-3 subunit delta'
VVLLSEVREQPEGVRFLKRVVEGHLTSPLLLVGDEGIGRRFSVVQAAKEAFSGGDPDSIHCFQIDEGVHPDLMVVSAGDKPIGVDAIRAVVDEAMAFPDMVPARYVIIDGVDTMTLPAADALLKTLEDPPHTTRFFLLAQVVEKVPLTVRSRCGLVRYHPLSEAFIVEHLKAIEEDPAKALVYSRLSGGSVGRATQFRLSGCLMLRNKVLSLLRGGLNKDLLSLFAVVEDLDADLTLGLDFLEHILRDLMLLPHTPDRLTNLDVIEELGELRGGLGDRRIGQLVDGLRLIRGRMQAKISLAFHVKTSLAMAFISE